MKLLKIIFVYFLALLYAGGMGSGWFFIYILGLREAVSPLYTLPVIPVSSFVIIYTIILYINTLRSKKDSNTGAKSYDISDPEPYGKMLTNLLTIYMYAGIIGLIYLIFS